MLVQFFARCKLHHFACFVLGPRQRTQKAESHWLVGHQLQVVAIHFHRGAFFGAAGHQTHRTGIAQANIVSARQTAAHQHSLAGGANPGIIRRARGHGQIKIAVFENFGPFSIPVGDHVGQALPQYIRNEEAAVEQNRVRLLPGRFKEGPQVATNCRIGHVRQP